MMVDPSEDDIVDEDGQPVFMPHVSRFDPHNLANETDFIVCLGGDGESKILYLTYYSIGYLLL